MKVLTINCTYKTDSTGKIIADIARCLPNLEFVFCYEAGEKPIRKNEYRIANKFEQKGCYWIARITGLKSNVGLFTTARLIRFIKKKHPDVVHIHCPYNNTIKVPWLLETLKKENVPTVITNHAESFYTGNCPHAFDCEKYKFGCGKCDYVFDSYRNYMIDQTAYEWKKMKRAFEGFDNLVMVCVSEWVMMRMKTSPIARHLPAVVIHNGVDCSIFKIQPSSLRNEIGDGYRKVILHVSANFSDDAKNQKGGRFVIELAKRLEDCLFVVCGTNTMNPSTRLPNNMRVLGKITSQVELSKFYTMADLTVITSQRETFGMVCAESLCCGTPVVGFKAGGPETIAIKEYSEFVEFGDVESLERVIIKWLTRDKINPETISKVAQEYYSAARMAREYEEVYKEIVGAD